MSRHRAHCTKRVAANIAAIAAVLAAGCGSDDDGNPGPRISATTGVAADIARQIAGPDAQVEQVIPDSASPHDFSLSAQDRAELEDSALLVSNGADLETGIPFEDVDVPEFAFADHAGELLAFGGSGEEDHAEEEEGDHGDDDPHLWMDPTRVAEAVPALGEAMAEADPDHAAGYRARANDYVAQLGGLDAEVERTLAAVPQGDRMLVTSHDALAYFADRYGFQVVATAFPASGPEAEASAASIQETEEAIAASGVPAVFAEETDDPQVLEQISERTGVEIVGGLLVETPGEAGSYVEMMRRDAELIAGALTAPG
ncbi:MAG TPA: metal ABC transporter substrate-binding protein [Solirubrobacterales bacterium]|jgi:ABC-type Zn uptake system ZnuABC Zn-binding protein ZnuA|nr:metal ABC transporter substrate-binding protein [Solirubrobacterales bacterium]